ncbi:MAG TPA: hypothetical protein VND96_16500 [Candidatus Micrarchaeaceae archaeon]|nr:hypothetical protein [Candidatus Micrarchaeaceae archaeon]
MQRLGDIYFSRDSPVLAEIARWEEQGRPSSLEPRAIAASLDCPTPQVIQSIGRLFRGRFVDCVDISTHGGENYIITGLTAEGFRESGLWPKPADLSRALVDVLQQEIESTSRSDPERSRKLKVVLDTLSGFGSDFLAKLAAELLKNLPR